MMSSEKLTIFHDIETYKNFFCVCVIDYASQKEFVFEISSRRNQWRELKEFYSNVVCTIGYNSKEFDDVVLNYILSKPKVTNFDIYEFSRMTFQVSKTSNLKFDKRTSEFTKQPWEQVDLMTMLFSKMSRVKLKTINISTKWTKIQEAPIDFEKDVEEGMFDEVINYCKNDTASTRHLLFYKNIEGKQEVLDRLKFRYNIKKTTGLDCLSYDDVKLGLEQVKKRFCEALGISKSEFYERYNTQTKYEVIHIKDILFDCVKFQTPEFQEVYDYFENLSIIEEEDKLFTKQEIKKKYNKKIKIGEFEISFGLGGAHSVNHAERVQPNENQIFITSDVASFYPSTLVHYGLYPKHLGEEFNSLCYTPMYYDRIHNKKIGNKLVSEMLKLSLNGTYGNLTNAFSWVGDRVVALSITVNDQLMISMLAERLIIEGFVIDELNTDGINFLIPKDKKDRYLEICEQWCTDTKMTLEHEEYEFLVRANVNNYLAKKTNGKIKEKGLFVREPVLGKGFENPIVSKALYNYFVLGKPVLDTFKESKDIFDFCIGLRIGEKSTKGEYDVLWRGEKQQNILRCYASYKGDWLYKKRVGEETLQNLFVNSPVMIFNDYVEREDYQINYDYYLEECNKVIYAVEGVEEEVFLIPIKFLPEGEIEIKLDKKGKFKKGLQYTLNELRLKINLYQQFYNKEVHFNEQKLIIYYKEYEIDLNKVEKKNDSKRVVGDVEFPE